MQTKINNLVFEGGGILGIAYLGTLTYLYEQNILQQIERVAGTSAGAITACITSFNLPFEQLLAISNSLDYAKIPDASGNGKDELFATIPEPSQKTLNQLFGDIRCVYRLLTKYGWYSTDYFYDWIKKVIADQFDSTKKSPPYTFLDFKDTSIHKDNHPFLDLTVIGTNLSYGISNIFSAEITPTMEVAEAIRISMSIPLFFETVKTEKEYFCDGGIMRNYPINIFDGKNAVDTAKYGIHYSTLGCHLEDTISYEPIHNFLDYVRRVLESTTKVQSNYYQKNPKDIERTIEINTNHTSILDFKITTDNATYKELYNAGYNAATRYFLTHPELLPTPPAPAPARARARARDGFPVPPM